MTRPFRICPITATPMNDTIKQRTRIVTIAGDQNVVVHRMRWRPACQFIQKLGKHLSGLGALLRPVPGSAAVAGYDAVAQLLPQISDLVVNVEELAEHLVTYSTDIPADKLAELDSADMLELIRVALELNTGDELKNSFAGIAANLAALVPTRATKMSSGDESTPSSSMPATAQST